MSYSVSGSGSILVSDILPGNRSVAVIMCFVLYMASDHVRTEIPWDESNPRFHVKPNDADALKAGSHFSKKTLYYLGSDNGCGCGFRRDLGFQLDSDEKTRASQEDNHRRLYEYVNECLNDETEVELYGCWSGDEECATEHTREIAAGDIISEGFGFTERELVVVRRSA